MKQPATRAAAPAASDISAREAQAALLSGYSVEVTSRDVEAVLETIRETEVLRAVAADEAAAAVGMSSNPSLSALADRVEEPWASILREHREAFVTATREITELADANRDLISTGYRSARDTLLSLGEESAGYGHDGSALVGADRHGLVDRSL